MKKLIAFILATCFLLTITAFSVNAYSGGALLEKYRGSLLENFKIALASGDTAIQKAIVDQQVAAQNEGEDDMLAFYKLVAANSKTDVKSYHLEYLSHLAETTGILGESNFNEYMEKKKEEVSFEITQDVTEFLSALLSK